jgi:hypothetical protein
MCVSRFNHPLINDFSKRYRLRPVALIRGSSRKLAEGSRKRGGRFAEAIGADVARQHICLKRTRIYILYVVLETDTCYNPVLFKFCSDPIYVYTELFETDTCHSPVPAWLTGVCEISTLFIFGACRPPPFPPYINDHERAESECNMSSK